MFVLDTNVISELMRPIPNPTVLAWLQQSSHADLLVPSIVAAELLYGIEIAPAGKKREAMAAFVGAFLANASTLDFTGAMAAIYATIGAHRRSLGRPISQMDCQIAATASQHNLPVVTRNVRDFEHCRIQVINPWDHP